MLYVNKWNTQVKRTSHPRYIGAKPTAVSANTRNSALFLVEHLRKPGESRPSPLTLTLFSRAAAKRDRHSNYRDYCVVEDALQRRQHCDRLLENLKSTWTYKRERSKRVCVDSADSESD
jgi:hypothetical protein